MKTTISLLLATCLAVFSGLAGAFDEVDFTARVANLPHNSTSVPKLISVAAFNNVQLASIGSASVKYVVSRVDPPTGTNVTMFNGSASIDSTQTQVTVGNVNTGRLVLTYDPTLDRLEARFTLHITDFPQTFYDIRAEFDQPAEWVGQAHISSAFP